MPVSKWLRLITMVLKSPEDRVVPLPNGQTAWPINGGLITNHLQAWDDPASKNPI